MRAGCSIVIFETEGAMDTRHLDLTCRCMCRGARDESRTGLFTGALGLALKQRQGATVVGVEVSEEYASEARSRLDELCRRRPRRFWGSELGGRAL